MWKNLNILKTISMYNEEAGHVKTIKSSNGIGQSEKGHNLAFFPKYGLYFG